MPKNNIYLPKENLARVEEVREIEEKELITPEKQAQVINDYKERWGLINNKSKLSPAARSKIIKRHGADYLSERAFDHDIALMQMYGPGFWDEFAGPVTKTLASMGGAALILGTGGAAAPVVLGGAAAALGGKLAKEVGKKEDLKAVEWAGDLVCDTGIGTLTGSIAGGSGSLASHIGKETAKGGHVVAGVMRTAKFSHDVYGKTEVGAECYYRKEHRKHRERGVSYDSNCPVCTKSWPFN